MIVNGKTEEILLVMKALFVTMTARLVDGNEVMGMKCCNGNSNEGMDMRIGNEDSFVWYA